MLPPLPPLNALRAFEAAAAGRLVKPFAREIDAERAYWLVLAGEPARRLEHDR